DHPHGGGFAGAVVAEKAGDLPGFHVERQVRDRAGGTVRLRQMAVAVPQDARGGDLLGDVQLAEVVGVVVELSDREQDRREVPGGQRVRRPGRAPAPPPAAAELEAPFDPAEPRGDRAEPGLDALERTTGGLRGMEWCESWGSSRTASQTAGTSRMASAYRCLRAGCGGTASAYAHRGLGPAGSR